MQMVFSVQSSQTPHTHNSRCVVSSLDRRTGEQEAGCAERLGFSQSTVWVHPAILCSVYFLSCGVYNSQMTVFKIDLQLYSILVSVVCPFILVCPQSISNPKPLPCSVFSLSLSFCCHPISAIGAQLAALAQQRWDLITFRWCVLRRRMGPLYHGSGEKQDYSK